MKRVALLISFFSTLFMGRTSGAEHADVVVHEWGTFTALQDEAGNAVGGINTEDEPVPPFVHDVSRMLLIPPTELPPTFFQGAPRCHPDVTLRLETPVLYVHAPESFHEKINLEVKFRGGWLTQYFPDAAVTAPGIEAGDAQEAFAGRYGPLVAETVGRLVWTGLSVGAPGAVPETAERVWLAPRNVDARMLGTANGEREKFVFYRGVGHVDAPLRVRRDERAGMLEIGPRTDGESTEAARAVRKLWLVDIRADGTAAFRVLDSPADPVVKTPAAFAPGDYSRAAVAQLRAGMRTALISEGLFADEADALLNTWELSYFKSVGLRLFFFVPAAWTDRVLPLTVSGTPQITRVMVARIELITPSQRALLATIAAGPVPDPYRDLRQPVDALTWAAGKNAEWRDLLEGKRTLREIGFAAPAVYRAYLDLGRFRNALLLNEATRHPTSRLADFIEIFQLGAYRVK